MAFGGHFVFFDPVFLPEVDNVDSWNTIPNLVMSNTTHISNYKKIESKLWSWQCPRFYDKNGGHDVSNYVNELKLKRTPLDIWETICGKFHWNRLGSFGVLARTDTHTDRHTDRQTDRQPGIFRPERSQYIQSMKMTECKKVHVSRNMPQMKI